MEKMIEAQDWLQTGRYIDVKDKYGDWLVGYILDAKNGYLKVRMDGWEMKYDELIPVGSSKLKPFRSRVRGYTGQKKNSGVREHMKFNAQNHLKKLAQFKQFCQNIDEKSEEEINQIVRGSHYFYVDFLLTLLLKTSQEASIIYNYFAAHLQLLGSFMDRLSSEQNIIELFYGPHRALYNSHFQIFDATISILEGCPRLKNFFRNNERLILEGIAPAKTSFQFNIRILEENHSLTNYKKIWKNLSTVLEVIKQIKQGTYQLKLTPSSQTQQPFLYFVYPFMRSLLHIFSSFQKMMFKSSEELKKLAIYMTEIMTKIVEIVPAYQQIQIDIEQLHRLCQQFHYKLSSIIAPASGKLLQALEILKLNVYKKLIESEPLQKKKRGIKKIKDYWEGVTADEKQKECYLIFLSKKNFIDWTKSQIVQKQRSIGLFQLIFGECEHQEVIRKGCELALILYKGGGLDFSDIRRNIWDQCINKSQIVKKTLYQFTQKLVSNIRLNENTQFVQMISKMSFVDQTDASFFQTVLEQYIQEHQEHPATKKLLAFAFRKLIRSYCKSYLQQNAQSYELTMVELQKFTKTLTMCSVNSDHMKLYAEMIFTKQENEIYAFVEDLEFEDKVKKILSEDEISNIVKKLAVTFVLKLLMYAYYFVDNKDLGLSENAWSYLIGIMVDYCKQIITVSTQKTTYSHLLQKILKKNLQKILKIIQFMQIKQFEFYESDLREICEAFYSKENTGKYKQLQIGILYKWMLKTSKATWFPVINYHINDCLTIQIYESFFHNYLVNPSYTDFMNLTYDQYIVIYNFFLAINTQNGALKMIEHKFTKFRYYKTLDFNNLQGLNELWKIFISCHNHQIIEEVIKNLLALYLNYDSTPETKNTEGIEKLLTKLQEIIIQSKIRANHRLIKYSLVFLQEAIISIKEEHQRIPREYAIDQKLFINAHKKNINLVYEGKCYEIKISSGEPFVELLKQASQLFKIPIYSLNLYIVKQNVIIPNSSMKIEKSQTVIDKIPKQYAYIPIISLLPSSYTSAEKPHIIKVQVSINPKYEYLKKFFSEKLQETILKILSSDSNAENSRECSQFAYNILVHIPTHFSKQQILSQLIEQIKEKNMSLKDHSIYYRMYFIKIFNYILLNCCQKDFSVFTQFVNQHTEFYQQILEHIGQTDITDKIHVELLYEIFEGIKKILDHLSNDSKIEGQTHEISIQKLVKELKLEESLNLSNVILCLKNVLEFASCCLNAQDWDALKNFQNDRRFLKLYVYSLQVSEHLTKQSHGQMLDLIIETGHLQRIIQIILRENLQIYRQFFVKTFNQLIFQLLNDPQKQCLKPKNQDILFNLIFQQIYSQICSNPTKIDSMTFSIFRDLIPILSQDKINCLVCTQNSFYRQKCLKIIKTSKDDNRQKQNLQFQGHLKIIFELIKRKPSIIDQELTKIILYDCLLYDPFQEYEETDLFKTVKCRNQNSIRYCLFILEEIVKSSKEFYDMIIGVLLKIQQTVEYRRNINSWSISLENEYKSTTGYVGMENPGCICYLNSLMQVLFNNKRFKHEVLNFQPQKIDTEKSPSVLMALKKLFINLQYSDRKQLSPIPFSKSLKTENNKPLIKLFEQMDIEEFSSILFEKIERELIRQEQIRMKKQNAKQMPHFNTNHFIKEIFEGKYSNEIISQECQHSSEREQHFISMQLDVKPSLDLALKSLVQGQILDGQNKYQCDKCDKKVRALKRLSIKHLPDSLLVCLKRFQYNFEYDAKIKVNSYCQFKEEFSFLPYTQEYLNNRQEQIEDKQNYEYRLKGVVIHTGSSDSGHYYAFLEGEEFIDQQKQIKKWYEFNDSYVNEFDKSKLPDEAFGNKEETDPKMKNAYMLVYQRKNKNYVPKEQNNHQVQKQEPVYTPSTLQLIKDVQIQNRQIHITELFFNKFYKKLVQELVFSEKLVSEQTISLFISYIMHFMMREESSVPFCEELMYLQNLIKKYYDRFGCKIFEKLLKQFGKCQVLFELFWECKEKQKAQTIVDFLINLLKFNYQRMNPDFFQDDTHNLLKQAKIFLKMLGMIVRSVMKNSIECGLSNQAMYLLKKMLRVSHQVNFPLFEIADCLNIFETIILIIRGYENQDKDRIIQCRRFLEVWETYIEEEFKDLDESMEEEDQRQSYTELNLSKPSFLKFQFKLDPRLKNTKWAEVYRGLKQIYVIRKERVMRLNFDPEQQNKNLLNANRTFSQIFNQFTDETIQSMIENCQTAKCVRGLSCFFVTVIQNDIEKSNKVVSGIKKGLQALQAIKYRSFLLLTYYLVMMDDALAQERMQIIINLLEEVSNFNLNYFSEIDLIFQWIMKIANSSKIFAKCLGQSDLYFQLSNEHHKQQNKPEFDLLKKHKIPTYERLNNLMHGIMVSISMDDYEKLHKTKLEFLQCIQKSTFISRDEPSEPSLEEDQEYEDIINQTLQLYYNYKWVSITVKNQKYNLLTLSKYKQLQEEIANLWASDEILRKFISSRESAIEFKQMRIDSSYSQKSSSP